MAGAPDNSGKADTGHKMPKGRRFAKGMSGNPKGRPTELKVLKSTIKKGGGALVTRLIQVAHGKLKPVPSVREQLRAIEILLHYGYGKPIQAIELSGPDGDPIGIEQKVDEGLDQMTTAELRAAAVDLRTLATVADVKAGGNGSNGNGPTRRGN